MREPFHAGDNRGRIHRDCFNLFYRLCLRYKKESLTKFVIEETDLSLKSVGNSEVVSLLVWTSLRGLWGFLIDSGSHETGAG